MNIKDALIAARAKIADKKNWCTEVYAISHYGEPLASGDDFAANGAAFCAIGACKAVASFGERQDRIELEWQMRGELHKAVEALYPSSVAVTAVNDNVGHDAVLALFDHAIANYVDDT